MQRTREAQREDRKSDHTLRRDLVRDGAVGAVLVLGYLIGFLFLLGGILLQSAGYMAVGIDALAAAAGAGWVLDRPGAALTAVLVLAFLIGFSLLVDGLLQQDAGHITIGIAALLAAAGAGWVLDGGDRVSPRTHR